MTLKPWTRQISLGHRAMYLGPAGLLSGAKSSVIDVGCGDGYGYHTLMSAGAISSYWGIDASESDIAKGRELLQDLRHAMICGDWLTYPEDQITPADFVFCIEVLEHLPPETRQAWVEKCKRFATRNVFISTPPVDRNDHGRLTIPECVALLRESGLDVVVVDVQWTTMYVCSASRAR